MITETIEWYTPAEKLPAAKRDVYIIILVFGFEEIVDAYYDNSIWYTYVYECEYPKDKPLFWCYALEGPNSQNR